MICGNCAYYAAVDGGWWAHAGGAYPAGGWQTQGAAAVPVQAQHAVVQPGGPQVSVAQIQEQMLQMQQTLQQLAATQFP